MTLQRVTVGKIGPAHGIRGDVYVLPLTDEPDLRFAPEAELIAGAPAARTLTVESAREHSGRLLVRFVGITDRGAAESLRGSVLETDIDPNEAPDDPEEFYDRHLIGLAAVLPDDTYLGPVTDVLHLPGQDVLEVEIEDGVRRLVPFVADIVPTVDLAGGRLIIDPPAGLLEDSDAEELSDDESPS